MTKMQSQPARANRPQSRRSSPLRPALQFAALFIAALAQPSLNAQTAPSTQPARQLFTLSKQTTIITAPLRPDGVPDYRAALTQQYVHGNLTPENNGVVLWLQLIGPSPQIDEDRLEILALCGTKKTDLLPIVWTPPIDRSAPPRAAGLDAREALRAAQIREIDEWTDAGRIPWIPTGHLKIDAYLTAENNALETASQAINRPQWWMPLNRHEFLSSPSPLGRDGDLYTALCARAMLRAKSGDFPAFLADILTVKKQSRNIRGNVNDQIRSLGIDSDANAAIAGAAGAGIFSAAQLQSLGQALDALRIPKMTEAVDVWERWAALEAMVTLSQSRNGILPLDPTTNLEGARFELIDAPTVDWDEVLISVNEEFDELLDAMRQPTLAKMNQALDIIRTRHGKWRSALVTRSQDASQGPHNWLWDQDAGESRRAFALRIARGFMAWSLDFQQGNLTRAEEMYRQSALQESMMRTILAAAEFKAKTGQWPHVLKDLVPGYLAQIPADIFSADGIYDVQFQISERGAWVYSSRDVPGKGNWAYRGGTIDQEPLGMGAK